MNVYQQLRGLVKQRQDEVKAEAKRRQEREVRQPTPDEMRNLQFQVSEKLSKAAAGGEEWIRLDFTREGEANAVADYLRSQGLAVEVKSDLPRFVTARWEEPKEVMQ